MGDRVMGVHNFLFLSIPQILRFLECLISGEKLEYYPPKHPDSEVCTELNA